MNSHRHAYLIIAHGNFGLLNTLISLLDDERNDIFLHIDKKAGPVPLLRQCLKSQLVLTPVRHDVRWGDVSLVKCELELYRTAYEHGEYRYFHLISGVDLPIKSQNVIHDFFDRNDGKEFISFFPDDDYTRGDIERKMSYYYFLMRWNARCSFVPKPLVVFSQIVRHSALVVQRMLHVRREASLDFKKGDEWASLTKNAVKLILDSERFILRRFSHTTCSDEIYKHSLIYSSPLRANIYCMDDRQKGNMRFIDFERAPREQQLRGEPYVWQDSDLDELTSSPFLFARKINPEASRLIAGIVDFVSKR